MQNLEPNEESHPQSRNKRSALILTLGLSSSPPLYNSGRSRQTQNPRPVHGQFLIAGFTTHDLRTSGVSVIGIPMTELKDRLLRVMLVSLLLMNKAKKVRKWRVLLRDFGCWVN